MSIPAYIRFGILRVTNPMNIRFLNVPGIYLPQNLFATRCSQQLNHISYFLLLSSQLAYNLSLFLSVNSFLSLHGTDLLLMGRCHDCCDNSLLDFKCLSITTICKYTKLLSSYSIFVNRYITVLTYQNQTPFVEDA